MRESNSKCSELFIRLKNNPVQLLSLEPESKGAQSGTMAATCRKFSSFFCAFIIIVPPQSLGDPLKKGKYSLVLLMRKIRHKDTE